MGVTGIVLSVFGAAANVPVRPEAELDFEECRLSLPERGQSVSARCFELEVPEDWGKPDGRKIMLKGAWVPASSSEASGAPLLMLAGGPGQAATQAFIPHVRALGPVRQNHPIILLDQRGTGQSNSLQCPEDDIDLEPDADTAVNAAARCLDDLEADTRQYTTSNTVRDLEAVREALAMPEWHVYGVSYGSRLGLDYLRRYPEVIKTLTVDGVVPADEILGPMIAPFAQQSVDRMMARCENDSACREAFPDLAEHFEALMAELAESPETVALRHPRTHESTEVTLSRAKVAQVVRFAAYQPEWLALMPLLLHQAAAEDDWGPLAAQWLLLSDSMQDSLSLGLHYSVICSEDVPFVEERGDLEQLGEPGFLGQDPMQMLEGICSVWPQGEIPDDFHEPVSSDKPVLLLSGELDPVTPPAWGDQAAASLSNARHLTLKGKGHNVVHLGCLPFLLRDFLAGTEPDALDTDCLEKMRPMPFFLDFSGPAA
ncbi:pimeloyl-ACP methyl ester carboxylesterase [Natronospira proteinivora]|uniref:Proline iminopeptidase n=1 Tax=Natronospira proteinivora TaxID=1807133 RepID=A0ABT1GA54_9GAMM|nr:alpha/beta hydrolase [Natronospira proteinivora]MCP1728203.1 pimeloyl-ACP methyl ester carboxylesterase [Natronospira proteinivora]